MLGGMDSGPAPGGASRNDDEALTSFSGAPPDLPVVPICRRHFRLRRRANHRHFSAHPGPIRGAFRDRHKTLGRGCGGRFSRDKTSAREADGEVVWS
jgi:hypothetical protein